MNDPPVMVDTSTWYAAASTGDRHNAAAKAVLARHPRRVTTDHILVETWRLICHRIGWGAAETWLTTVRTGLAAVEHVREVDVERGIAIGREYPDQRFSLVDRTTFAAMERLRHTRVITFDDDFLVFRYGPDRAQAFTVLR